MEAKEYLKKYKKDFEPLLREYFDSKKKSFKKVDPLAYDAVKILEKFTLSGGKRIRPAMVYYGFLLAGGDIEKENKKKIVHASIAIELIHSFLLIHDDIIDRDEKRHGTDTVHENYRKIAEKLFPATDPDHFGNSMAIIVGDLAASMANEVLFEADFPSETILAALKQLQKVVYTTIPGEMLDVLMEAKGEGSEEEILRMYEGKTAFYTFEGPLHLGIILANTGSDELLRIISNYSGAIGKAFQLQDDILGIFGDEKKLGKPIGSDIIEGKQTLLLRKALDNGSDEDKRRLEEVLNKNDLSSQELADFQRIIEDSGSLDYSRKLAKDFSEKALNELKKINKKHNKEARNFLEEITKYISNRDC